MKLYLRRQPTISEATPGDLHIEDKFFCHTLEDAVREVEGQPVESWKIPKKTAIPRGIYRIDFTWSDRFQAFRPILLNVTGFTGIRIHSGNTKEDTEGCIMVGFARAAQQPDFLGDSRRAIEQLTPILANAWKREAVLITVA